MGPADLEHVHREVDRKRDDSQHEEHEHDPRDVLLLCVAVLRHLEDGVLRLLIHFLVLPLAIQQFAKVDVIEVGKLHQDVQVGHVAARLPARHGPARHEEVLRQLFLGETLLLAELLEKPADPCLVHDHLPSS